MTNINLDKSFQSSVGAIRYGNIGQGPDVFLMHGTPTSSIIWEDIVEALKHKYHFHFMDLPGYGESEKFEGQDVRLRSFARALNELIQELEIENPTLVGHDFGAATVMGAHLIEGLPVNAICVADGVLLSPWGTKFSRHVKENEAIFAAVPEYIHEATIKAHLNTAMSTHQDRQKMKSLIAPWLGEVGQKAYYSQVGQYDYDYTTQLEDLYPTINVPMMIMWGERDQWVPISEGKRLQTMIKNAEFAALPDAGHFSMIDTPGLFANTLDAWLSKVSI
ncbi:alpha/beta hydrolase [Amylibacter sp. SFDW26]|uniref:alpha/beta fold hydrolase n=1 Tax=Amylibacter sp. SFDW26 TaxID=2652722 RepID=UPI0012624790|nr:alpha/beta hydrolase [Amylibacter sp. SFDW26]KAB7613934.1 alpha/beta hydrolase [Amylibacter sp. SFDW26]